MADNRSPSAASAASSACYVYRLKHNPSWTKFGMHPRVLTDTNARPGHLTSPCASAHRASESHYAAPSANASFLCTTSARQPASVASVALVGAQAALRHEQCQRVHTASRITDLRSSAVHASGPRRAAHPTASGSAFMTPRARGDGGVKGCAPESASWEQAALPREEAPLAVTPMSTTLTSESGSGDQGGEMRRISRDALSSASADLSCRAEVTYDPPIRYSALSLQTASLSRAKDSHLRGSAALVAVAGPLDALYVPLRRPAPRGCVATRQNFSISEGARRTRSSDRSAMKAGAVTGGSREARVVRCGIVGGAPEADTYRTSSSAYGRGC
ncbi:hypothetical protein LSCM1_00890 [Leishmania martiniquensis]|uniref:Uncharacterized protein n=1 Tax=Leishmania martiniquensis TaxID=1580590 RepID=A0A836KAS7_9TRYP|nr:hypothetical protein LSCM1_00890 [Leishmania martiniquensis]